MHEHFIRIQIKKNKNVLKMSHDHPDPKKTKLFMHEHFIRIQIKKNKMKNVLKMKSNKILSRK